MSEQSTVTARDVDIAGWRSIVSQSFVPLDIDPLTDDFLGNLSATAIDQVVVFDVSASPHVVRRTEPLIALANDPYYKLSLQLEGHSVLEQDGRTAIIEPGNLAIYDTSRPYTLTFPHSTRLLVIMVPHALVDLPRATIADVTAHVFSEDSVLGRVVIPFLSALGGSVDELRGPQGIRVVHTAVDLIVTLLSSELHIDTDPRRRLASDVRAYIDARLDDSSLNPADIAKAHFVSPRHLHAVFSAEGVTLAAWIRERRLERIRRDLSDAMLATEPVGSIAARWGLGDAAHFSKLFRERYGQSPSIYRKQIFAEPQQSAEARSA